MITDVKTEVKVKNFFKSYVDPHSIRNNVC